VTNAFFVSLHGLSVGPFPRSTMPVPLRKARARHERQRIGRISGWLPSALGSGVALRLHSRRLSACASLPPLAARRPKPHEN